jgi:preprotein translocase subunit SecE
VATSDKAVSSLGMWSELFATGIYKRTQGKLARQLTFLAIAVLVLAGCWQLYERAGLHGTARFAVPTVLAIVGLWVGYRIVNIPHFADFLIAVEAEMNKVSWPSQDELVRASIVVIGLMAVLTVVLFAYDLVWQALLAAIGVIPPRG